MKKLILLLGVMLFLVSCKSDDQEFANQSAFSEAETPKIEHVSIPLTNSQLLELFHNMSPLAQTRVVVFNLLTEREIEFWSSVGPGVLAVYFTATWSGPAKMYGPRFESVANEYSNNECYFGRIDVDKAKALAGKYNIVQLPTTLIIKDNSVVARAIGPINKTTLEALVDQYAANAK